MLFSKFLNPKNDVAFKRLFGQERNKDILIHFLNDVLDLGDSVIQDIRYLPTIQDPEAIAKKESIVDVLCEDQYGKKYIIEMQISATKGFIKRAQFYASRAYGRQLNEGEEYDQLKEVIFLAITDFEMFPEKAAYRSCHVILDRASHEHDLKDFSFTFIELPKFEKEIHECKTLLEKWTYFFKHAEETSEDELAILIGQDKIIEKAYHEVNKSYWNEAEMNAYESEQKRVMDNKAALEYAIEKGEAIGLEKGEAIGLEKGEAIGLEKGEAIGLEKGEAIGLEKGEAIGLEKGEIKALHKTAKTMRDKGFDLETISSVTGLSKEEITNL